MKQNRRNFLQVTSGALLAGMAHPLSAYASPNPLPAIHHGEQPDESYWKLVRKQFPLNPDLVYLNNGTLGPSPYPVIEATQRGMMAADTDMDYGGWENTCKKLAAFTGVSEQEISLTRNVTEGINIVSAGLDLKKGDEVILTTHEHGGNALPWLNIARHKGVVIRTMVPGATADETLGRIAALVGKKTKVIAVPHILCTQGQIFPAKEICRLGREKGLFVFVDGAHGPGMLRLDLHDMDCDAYASCCHKWMLGPKGTGFLYVKKESMKQVMPMFVGAGSDDATWNMAVVPPVMGSYAADGHRFYAGTFNGGLYKGVNAAIDFIETIGMDRIHERITSLAAYVQEQMLAMDGKVEMLTPVEKQSRGAVIGFRIKDVKPADFAAKAGKEKIRIRQVHENGLNSLRVSTHIYNSREETDKLLELIRKV